MKGGAEIGVKLPQAKECLLLPDLEEPRMHSFLETSEVGRSYPYLDFGLSASRTLILIECYSPVFFKKLSLWCFVIATLGNEYNYAVLVCSWVSYATFLSLISFFVQLRY